MWGRFLSVGKTGNKCLQNKALAALLNRLQLCESLILASQPLFRVMYLCHD